jgi:hypothetical protein
VFAGQRVVPGHAQTERGDGKLSCFNDAHGQVKAISPARAGEGGELRSESTKRGRMVAFEGAIIDQRVIQHDKVN